MKKILIVVMSLQLCSLGSFIASDEECFDFVDQSFPELLGMHLGDALSNYIASVKDSVQQESSFVEKSIILAQGKAEINDLVDADQIDLQIARGEFDLMLADEQRSIQAWQNYCECIIGRTRHDIAQIKNLPEIANRQFDTARAIYHALKDLEHRDFTSIAPILQRYEYESLDSFVRQALDTAIEQGLGIVNIEDVMHRYRYHYVY